MFKMSTFIFKFTLGLIIMSVVLSVLSATITYYTNFKIVEDQLPNLGILAADSNCIDKDSGVWAGFENTLSLAETNHLTFTSFKVTDPTGTKIYDSYLKAPQRYSPIKCTLEANIRVRLFIPGFEFVNIPVTKSTIVLGTHFYKDK